MLNKYWLRLLLISITSIMRLLFALFLASLTLSYDRQSEILSGKVHYRQTILISPHQFMENHNKSKQNFVAFTSTSNVVSCPQEWENRKIPDVLLKKRFLSLKQGVTLETHSYPREPQSHHEIKVLQEIWNNFRKFLIYLLNRIQKTLQFSQHNSHDTRGKLRDFF